MKIRGNGTPIKHFTDLVAWQEGHKLVLGLYRLTEDFPRQERYGLTDQLRRAAISVTANIAEGFSRYHFKERAKFYYTARGSVGEIENGLLAARDLRLITTALCEEQFQQCEKVQAILNGLIRSTLSR